VAEGSADVYLRGVPTMEWDTAAAHCLVNAAGGQIVTLDGEPLRYGKATLRNPGILTLGDASFPWSRYLS
jgi:3'(2'), 5'-bisphosphate nucleotidase